MKTKIIYFISLLLSTILFSCSSPKHLLKIQDYDASIAKTLGKMRGASKKVKAKQIEILHEAFRTANNNDLALIKKLQRAKQSFNWIQINDIYNAIIERQDLVRPFVHFVESYGFEMTDLMRNFADLEYDSRKKSANYLYSSAMDMMSKAREGDKLAARRAYSDLVLLDSFFEKYKNKEDLKSEAIVLGTEHIQVKVANLSTKILPRNLHRRLLDFEVERLNDLFHRYYVKSMSEMAFDYQIRINLLDMNITPESNRITSYQETKEINDGFEYVLDSKGNVLKDSLGNDIKFDKTKTIIATVEEIFQYKAVGVSGNIELFDMQGERIIRTRPINAEAVFENFAATYRGDREALTAESRNKIGNNPRTFPSSDLMLEQALDLLRPVILNSVERMKGA